METIGERIGKKLKIILLCALIFNGVLGLVFMWIKFTVEAVGVLISFVFPNILAHAGLQFLAGIAAFVLEGFIIYYASDFFAFPFVKDIKKIRDAASKFASGEVVDVAWPGAIRLHGIAQKDWQNIDSNFIPVYFPHTPTIVTGQEADCPKEKISPSAMSKKDFAIFIASGGMVGQKTN